MSLFKALSEEHGLLLVLVGRLERATDTKDARNLLLVLLRALEAHENLEHLVFDAKTKPSASLTHVERQHKVLGSLRAEALALLQGLAQENDAAVRGLQSGVIIGSVFVASAYVLVYWVVAIGPLL